MPHRLAAVVLSLLVLSLLTATAQARNGRTVRIHDSCEPASFNLAIGPGTCVGDGEVTFGEFLAALNPVDGGHPDWNFSREQAGLEPGERLRARNRGGETHTFTEVVAFGATTLVPFLNAALPPGTPDAVPIGDLNFVAPGERLEINGLSAGTHFFECLIHPWMRTTVSVS